MRYELQYLVQAESAKDLSLAAPEGSLLLLLPHTVLPHLLSAARFQNAKDFKAWYPGYAVSTTLNIALQACAPEPRPAKLGC